MKPARWACLCLVLAVATLARPAPASGQLEVSGHLDLLARTGGDERLNRNFRGDSPFSLVRARIFGRHWVDERIGVFTEVLFDQASGPRLQGAYVVVNDIAGREWLGVRAGLAPSIIGTFGLRSTYFNVNPLIGVPLVWQHRTTVDGSGLASAEDLLRRRETNLVQLPMLYDACWNLQWEILGETGAFEYSLGVTPGSLSNPLQSPDEDGVQVLARVGVSPTPGIRLGISGAIGPYIGGPPRDPGMEATSFPGSVPDYDQRLVGVDAEILHGRLHLYSEGYLSTWEVPLVAEDLTVGGGYVEARFDPLPRWTGALRVGAMGFSRIDVPGVPGERTGWDDDLLRVESAVTYRLSREVHLRAGWQRTEFLTGDDPAENLVAAQLRAVF